MLTLQVRESESGDYPQDFKAISFLHSEQLGLAIYAAQCNDSILSAKLFSRMYAVWRQELFSIYELI